MHTGFGLDFGTTNSVVAQCSDVTRDARGRLVATTLPFVDRTHARPHPSVVWYRVEGPPVVGAEARENVNGYADQAGHAFVSSIKRRLGKGGTLEVLGRHLEAEDVAFQILTFLKERALTDYAGALREVFLTVPIYFDGRSRRELRRAAQRAGLYVKGFVHEPFAAAVGCLYGRGAGKPQQILPGMFEHAHVLVFDWGGGTLDITLAVVRDRTITELATGGLPARAGDDFDHKLMQHCTSKFADRHHLRPGDLQIGSGTKDRLRSECEMRKIALSSADTSTVEVAALLRHKKRELDLSETVTRGDFEGLIRSDVEDAMLEVERVLSTAKLTPREIDLVLLVGGTSRVPMVRQLMIERFGTRVVEIGNADTVIAEGAAIVDALRLQPVLGRTLSIRLSDGSYHDVFAASLPMKPEACRATVRLFCTDNRDGQAKLVVCEKIDREYVTKAVLPIPVARYVSGRVYPYETVTAEFSIDEDFVLKIHGRGETQEHTGSMEIHDLCFGLNLDGGEV